MNGRHAGFRRRYSCDSLPDRGLYRRPAAPVADARNDEPAGQVAGFPNSRREGERLSDLLALFSRCDGSEYGNDADEQITRGLDRHFSYSPPKLADVQGLSQHFMDSRVPETPTSVHSYVRYLFEDVVPNSVRTHDRHFVGHMTSPLPTFVHAVGRIMTALNQNVVKLETSNALTFQERQALAILHRLVYGRDQDFYDFHIQRAESTLGMVASGGTLANMSAMWCARNARLGPKDGFAGIFQTGLSEALRAYGYRRAVIVGSSLMHYSLEKAVDLLGMGRQALIRVPATEDGSVNLVELEQTLHQCAAEGDLVLSLVGIAGTTETGAVDPLCYGRTRRSL